MIRTSVAGGSPEAAAAFQASQFFFLIVIFVAPLLIGPFDLAEYIWLACFSLIVDRLEHLVF
jgi:hypothetical protein